MKSRWLPAITLCLPAVSVFADDIVAGPIIGHVTDKSARVWVQVSVAKEVGVSAYLTGSPYPVCEIRVDAAGPSPFVADVPLNGLQPNKEYRLEFKMDGQPVAAGPGSGEQPLFIHTMPPPGTESAYSVAFGGSMNPNGAGTASIFKAVTAAGPRAFFFLGDSGYLPEKLARFPQTRRAAFRYIADFHAHVRAEPDLQTLFHTCPIYAVWNDHDFGVTGADKTFVFAKESLAAFQHFYPNPDWGTPEVPGCFFSLSIGDSDFFCLDDRIYRDPPSLPIAAGQPVNTPAPREMFGKAQMGWLETKLLASKATFKVIAGGGRFLGTHGLEGWSEFQPEQAAFEKFLFEKHITGVIFLSGGSDFGELTMRKPGVGEYPLFDLTAGPLATLPAAPGVGGAVDPAVTRVGDAVVDNTFGTLDFSGTGDHRFVTLHLRDAAGKTRLEQTLFAVQLR